MTTTPTCSEEIAIPLTGRDIWVIRQGLDLLLASSTRHEHIYHDIHTALERLPRVHEPRGSECDCFGASPNPPAAVPGTSERSA
jgi:hypothetical protein